MGFITIRSKGNFNQMERFLNKMKRQNYMNILDKYGQLGVEALAANTPKDSGKTASSWYYEIQRDPDKTTISWLNSNVNKGVVIAVILQYGHGTGTGGYVEGRDYINPAMRPIFDSIAEDAWKEVVSS